MSIIPEGRSELQRVPADGSGKTAFVQKGGYLALAAEGWEEAILTTAERDLGHAKALLAQETVSKHELTLALGFLYQSAKAAVDTARCRQERLDDLV